MYKAQEFKLYDTVIFHSTGSEELDGVEGVIMGIPHNPAHPAPHHYIVLLDVEYGGSRAISITEACLMPFKQTTEGE